MRSRIRWDLVVGVVVLVDVLRVYLPSLITVFGSAGSTPAEYIGLYAVVWFGLAFAAIPLCRGLRADRVALLAGLGLVAARLALQFTDGGRPQLYLATAGLVAGLVWLIANAMRAADARPAAIGVIAGLATATAVHAALGSMDLVWRDGLLAWAGLAVELVALAAALWCHRESSGTAAAARFWFGLGPAILLWGMYTGNPDYAAASDALPVPVVVAVVVGTGLASVALVAWPRWSRHRLIPAVALTGSAFGFAVAPTEIDAVAYVAPAWTLAVTVVGQLALAGCLGWAAAPSGDDRPTRRGTLVAVGMLAFLVLTFGFYAAYDLGLPNRWVPIVAALGVAAVVLAGRSPDRAEPVRSGRRTTADTRLDALTGPAPEPFRFDRRTIAIAAAVAAVVGTSSWLAVPATLDSDPPTDGLRVAAYNVRMGFGQAGTLTLDEQAATLARLDADVIALSEVDRGWLLNGGHDNLRRIADRLGMRHVWAPAADELWGDALLTRLPVTHHRNHPLVQGGPTGAQALEVGITWRGRNLTVIATHTQPPPDWRDLDQAEQLAGIVADAKQPVIVMGDLNTEPGDPAFAVLLDAGVGDAFADARPMNTIPGDDPGQQIDHVLVSPGFTARDPANPNVPYSDHRPIAVTLVPIDH